MNLCSDLAMKADDGAKPTKTPLITFHRLIPSARYPSGPIVPPQGRCRLARSAIARLPHRLRVRLLYLPPDRLQRAVGRPRHDLDLAGAADWYPLSVVQFPGFRDQFDAIAPEEIREFSPPFLSALQEPGLLQIWTGLVIRTAPGWSALVRAPANVPRTNAVEPFEGVIETDRWFGPLITNVRLTKTNVPINFRADFPFLQVQPIPRDAYDDARSTNTNWSPI